MAGTGLYASLNSTVMVAINDEKPEWYIIESLKDEDWKDKGLEDEWN